MDWQNFILCLMFGWREIKTENKRYGSVIISVARGQGKTYLMSIIACYSYLIETMGLDNQDLMVTSNITDQARKIWLYFNHVNKIIDKNAEFNEVKKNRFRCSIQ